MAGEPEREARPALTPSPAGAQGRRAARQRLMTARSRLDAVLRMLEADRYCAGILHQLPAVEAVITRARRDIPEGHLRGCVAEAVRGGSIATGDVADEVLATVSVGAAPAARAERRAVLVPMTEAGRQVAGGATARRPAIGADTRGDLPPPPQQAVAAALAAFAAAGEVPDSAWRLAQAAARAAAPARPGGRAAVKAGVGRGTGL